MLLILVTLLAKLATCQFSQNSQCPSSQSNYLNGNSPFYSQSNDYWGNYLTLDECKAICEESQSQAHEYRCASIIYSEGVGRTCYFYNDDVTNGQSLTTCGVNSAGHTGEYHVYGGADACIYQIPTAEENVMKCGDGSHCNGANEGWDCCSMRGGREQCPPNLPYMCARENDCGGGTSHCCSLTIAQCNDKDGLRECNELAFWDSCSWKTGGTQITIGGNYATSGGQQITVNDGYTGFQCGTDEILIGFKLKGNDESHEDLDPIEARCCTIGGHSSLTGECTYFKADGLDGENIDEFGNPWITDGTITNGEAKCNYDGHKVFTGVFDKFSSDGDIYHETKAGKCCEVECDASYCADNQWGVSDECETYTAPLEVVGEYNLICPQNMLLTKVIDGDEGEQEGGVGVQMHHKIVCCKFDIVAPPTFAPSLAPTTEEPTAFPTKAPTPSPTTAPTLSPTPSPTTAPSPAPTPMPTPSPTTAPTFMPTLAPSKAPTTGCETCLSTIYDLEFTERDDFLKAIETCMPECCLEEHIEYKISCDWIALDESECPTDSETSLLPECSINMADGELCEADVTLPNGNAYNVDNCDSGLDVFRYECEQTQCKCADYETEWGACIDSCPDEECEDSYTLNNGQVCRICKVSPDYPSWWTLSAVNMGSGIGFSSLAIVGVCSMFYMVTKFVTKREYQYIAEPHEV